MNDRLVTAQQAMQLPEVQEMVRQLAAHNLGVFMPHMHNEAGDFLPLPEGTVQVENDQKVSFCPADQVADTPEQQYVTVGWRWSMETNQMGPVTRCTMKKDANGNWYHTPGTVQ